MNQNKNDRRARGALGSFLAAALALGGCGGDTTTNTDGGVNGTAATSYTVRVSGLPMTATALHAIAIAEGRAFDGLGRLPLGMYAGRDQVSFSVEPPATTAGRLSLSLAVLADKDCLVGLGEGSVALGQGQTLTIQVQALPMPVCPSGGTLALPYVLSASPAMLTPGQATQVTLNGFGFLPGVVVLINGTPAQMVQYNSPTQIVVTTPATVAGGPVTLSVQNPGQPAQTTMSTVTATLSEAKLVVSDQVIRGLNGAIQIAAVDINNDKKIDLVIGHDNGNVQGLYGTGAGIFPGGPSFSPSEAFAFSGGYPGGATRFEYQNRLNLVDINQDGLLDLAHNEGGPNFLFAAGKAATAPPFEIALVSPVDLVGGTTTSSLVGDLNNDGAPDFVLLSDASGGAVHATLRQPKGISPPYLRANFAKSIVPGVPTHGELTDLDGDGKLDIVVAGRSNQVCGLLNQLDPNNLPRVTDPPNGLFLSNITGASQFCQALDTVGVTVIGFVVADFDGDKLPDIAVLQTKLGDRGYLTVLYNSKAAAGQISRFRKVTDKVGSYPYGLAAGDLNGDGRPELVVANRLDGVITVLTNDGSGGLDGKKIAPRAIPVDRNSQSVPLVALAILDVNGDGRLDIVTGYNNLYIIMNQGLMTP